MGIFGVHMPVIYGEGGEKAFLRLQKEVISTCPDQTIFAWGLIHPRFHDARTAIQYSNTASRTEEHDSLGSAWYRTGTLLATSPADFAESRDLQLLSPYHYRKIFGHAADHTCTFSADGITLCLPISSRPISANNYENVAVHGAALACTTTAGRGDFIIFLFLIREAREPEDANPYDPTFVSVGAPAWSSEGLHQYLRGAAFKLPTGPLDRGGLYAGADLGQARAWPSGRSESDSNPSLADLNIRSQEVRIAADVSRTFRNVRPHLHRVQPSPIDTSAYTIKIPSWVFDRLKHAHGFDASFSANFHQTVHKAFRVAFFKLQSSDPTRQHTYTSYILFVNTEHKKTLGVAFGLWQVTSSMQWSNICWMRVFIAPGVLDNASYHDVLAALEAHEILPQNRVSPVLRRVPWESSDLPYSQSETTVQPIVYPTVCAEHAATPCEVVLIWTAFSEHSHHGLAAGHLIISINIVPQTPPPPCAVALSDRLQWDPPHLHHHELPVSTTFARIPLRYPLFRVGVTAPHAMRGRRGRRGRQENVVVNLYRGGRLDIMTVAGGKTRMIMTQDCLP